MFRKGRVTQGYCFKQIRTSWGIKLLFRKYFRNHSQNNSSDNKISTNDVNFKVKDIIVISNCVFYFLLCIYVRESIVLGEMDIMMDLHSSKSSESGKSYF